MLRAAAALPSARFAARLARMATRLLPAPKMRLISP
jgi:hypothetical protein